MLAVSADSARAQWIYLTESPSQCSVNFDAQLFVYPYTVAIHAPDQSDATGAVFRIDAPGLQPEDTLTVVLAAGVTIQGNLLTGAMVTWTPRPLVFAGLMSVQFVDRPPTTPDDPWASALGSVRDVFLMRSNAMPLALEAVTTQKIHCYEGGGTRIEAPKSTTVTIGTSTVLAFRGVSSGGYWGPGATNLNAIDTRGWAGVVSPNVTWNNGCGDCPWWWEPLSLVVTVPSEAAEGDASVVTIREGTYGLLQFTVVAARPTPVETRTLGSIKALYR